MAYKKIVIDVSYHNGTIDWQKVKKSGCDAIIRMGYGDNVTSQDDVLWEKNYKAAKKAGVKIGAYFYSYAKSEAQAKSELAHALRLIKGKSFDYPIYFDSEEPGTEKYAAKAAKIFCAGIKKAGFVPGIYASESWWNSYLKKTFGNTYTKWIAKYGTNTGKPQTKPNVSSFDMWQYTSVGKVSGVSGKVDLSICYKQFSKTTGTVKAKSVAPASKPVAKKKTVAQVAKEVIAGKWGNGQTRKTKLKKAGYDYKAVQAKVNKLMAKR